MNRPSDLALLAWQIEALYRVDSAGRLLAVNEPGPEAEQPPAPRFFLGRTTQGNLWRFRHDLPADLTAALDERCRQEPVTADLTQPPQQAEAIRTLLHDHAPIASEYQGPAFWIPEATTHAAPATVIRLARENQHLLATTLPELLSWSWLQVRSPALATVVDGQAVAICFCARLTDHVAEAGVETAPACRGRGYASAAVAAWAAALRQTGRLPLYSTWWANHASQAVARKLGMALYGEDWSID
jgi:RimJ/RimL family protein N-acetyltransferase